MGYNTDSTEWPSNQIPLRVKVLIDRFFNLLDTTSDGVGDILAEEIFTPYAKVQFGLQNFEGEEQIRRSRDGAWKLFIARDHRLLRVYSHDNIGSDLLFVGHVAMHLKNGKHVAGEFTGRFTIADPESEDPRLKSYSIWADSAPLVKALQET